MTTHYETLHVGRDAPSSVIKSAYRALVREHHPDHGGADTARMRSINTAFEVLRDPEARSVYDRSLSSPHVECPGPNGPDPAAPDAEEAQWGSEQPWDEPVGDPRPPPRGPETFAPPPTGNPYEVPAPSGGSIPRYDPHAAYVPPAEQALHLRMRALSTSTIVLGQRWAARVSGLMWCLGSLTIVGIALATAPSAENVLTYGIGTWISIWTGLTRIRRGRLTPAYLAWHLLIVGAVALGTWQWGIAAWLPAWLWWLALVLAVETRAKEMRQAWR